MYHGALHEVPFIETSLSIRLVMDTLFSPCSNFNGIVVGGTDIKNSSTFFDSKRISGPFSPETFMTRSISNSSILSEWSLLKRWVLFREEKRYQRCKFVYSKAVSFFFLFLRFIEKVEREREQFLHYQRVTHVRKI